MSIHRRSDLRNRVVRLLLAASCLAVWFTVSRPAHAQLPKVADGPALQRRSWTINGVEREAMLAIPPSAKTTPTPVVVVFHGHGGRSGGAARTFALHSHWPEAIVVYPQGLNTPGQLTDKEGKLPGWQSAPGNQDDRDLQFFDQMLASLKAECQVDDRRVYATGHSNGGGFTYLLWATRGDVLAAVAPSSAVAARVMNDLKPKPVMHIAGEKDPLVKFAWQKATMDRLRQINHCEEQGQEWAPLCSHYASRDGTPVVTLIHPGDHKFYADAPPLIVRFFKAHSKP
jgi:polyhydroxybutyrate depolymerase